MNVTLKSIMLCLALFCMRSVANPLELQRGNGPEPDSLDPHRAQGLSAQNILRDLYEGLTREDAHGKIEGAAAASWQISNDGLVWQFQLRDGLRFSDGSALTAEDFVYSFHRALAAKTAAPYATQLLVIAGATARLKDSASPLGVRAIDAKTLEIRLTRPSLDLAGRLSLPIAMPVSKRCIERWGDQCSRPGHLISNGAFFLADWRPLSSIGLKKNPHYWQAAQVSLAGVRFHVTEDASEEARRFNAGELHLSETVPPGRLAALRAKYGSALHVAPSLGSFYLGFNLERPPFQNNLPLRQALSLAIDRRKITDIITGMGELPAWRLLPPSLQSNQQADRRTQAQREDQARKLLQVSGFDVATPIELRYNTSLLHRRLMLAISVMWEQVLGVRTLARQEEWKVFVQNRRTRRITEVFRMGWNADLADPMDFLETFAPDSPLNATGFRHADFSARLDAARMATDASSRLENALAAEQLLMDQQVILPLFFYTSKHLISPSVQGFVANALDHHPSRLLSLREAKP